MMAMRDLAYMWRIRILTNNELSWRRAFDVIFLWEFASSITPSVVGGAPIAILLLNREGISLGKSTAIILITSLFDELFYITMVPLFYLMLPADVLFPVEVDAGFLNIASGTKSLFYLSYFLICLYSIFISIGIFKAPHFAKKLLGKIFSISFLKRWKEGALKTGDEIILASQEAKTKNWKYWIKTFAATYLSWTARYLVVNFLILAFIATNEHVLIFGRQLVMWVIMLISPTPGGSGLAEFAFNEYLKEFIPYGLAPTLAFLWRLISYYPYIFIGVLILPGWLRRVYFKRKLITFGKKQQR
jgi:hypothetical protein